jgi:hypothetical protein
MGPNLIMDTILDKQLDEILVNDSGFPDSIMMIGLGNGKYAAINATTPPPDPMTVGLLAVFASEEEISKFNAIYDLGGDNVTKKFEEAREIALSKTAIHGLALQENGKTIMIHWVR